MLNIEKMTLREKIGQIVMAGFDGKEPTDGIRMLIRDYKLGGIIYFRRNVGLSAEVATLSVKLRRAAAEVSDVPLLIAIDQEGGMVARIDQDVAVMPGNMALGATGSAEFAYETARVAGSELLEMGININFAPCLDVNNNPANPVIGVRSYGELPAMVAELGTAAIRGYQVTGVSACAKHFPGHGDTAADSHQELPLVPHDRERLDSVELAPFRSAIADGVDAIMTAHVQFPAYEPSGEPATLSKSILSGLLRDKLGFEGVIVTDCLEMKAISEGVGIAKGAVMAVNAGADLVLVSHELDRQLAALDALYAAAESGEIPMERIDEAVRRVLEMKRMRSRAAMRSGASVQAVDATKIGTAHEAGRYHGSSIGSPEHMAVGRMVSEASVTVVKNERGALPLRSDVPTLAVWPEVRRWTEVEEVIPQEMRLGKALSAYIHDIKEIRVGIELEEQEIVEALAAAEGRSQIVVGTYNATFSPGQVALVNALLARGEVMVVVVALRNPYDLLAVPNAHAYVACYENRPFMMEALAKVLYGIIPPSGKLPVTLSEQYPVGFGLASL